MSLILTLQTPPLHEGVHQPVHEALPVGDEGLQYLLRSFEHVEDVLPHLLLSEYVLFSHLGEVVGEGRWFQCQFPHEIVGSQSAFLSVMGRGGVAGDLIVVVTIFTINIETAVLPHVFEDKQGDPAGVLLAEQGQELLVLDGTVGRVVSFVTFLGVFHHQFELLQHDDVVLEVPHGGDGKAALDLAKMGARVQFDELVHLLLSPRSRLSRHGDQTPGGLSVVGGSSVGSNSPVVVRSLVIACSSGVPR